MAKIYCKSSYLLRRDTAENWQNKNPILRKGEQGLETDTGIMKIGDGTTEYNSLSDNNIYLPKSHNKNIDQTYTPDSENAQSGKAVAEAVAIEQKRTDNTFANALKGNATGQIVSLSDVSPNEHTLGVKVSSKNLWQNTNTTFPSALSYNSTNQTYILGAGTAGYNFVAHTLTNPIPVGTTVTISIMFQSGKGRSVAIGGYHRTGGTSWQGYINVPSNVDMTGQTLTSTFTTTETVEEFMVFHNTGDNIEDPFVFRVQYELGSTATSYTPYISDLTTVNVTRCGKNLCVDVNDRTDVFFSGSPTTTYNITGSQLIKGFAVNGNATNYHITDFVNSNGTVSFKTSNVSYTIGIDVIVVQGETYTVSANITGGAAGGSPIWVVFLKDGLFQSYTTAQSFTVPNNCNQAILLIRPSDANTECSFSNIQLELGTTATDYEPYKEYTEYTPTADGTVEGVTSLYPNTTLMTDTEGVIIDCEYNRDINKAFAALEAAIATNNS